MSPEEFEAVCDRFWIWSLFFPALIWVKLIQGFGFSNSSIVKNPPTNAGDTGDWGLIPGIGRSPGGGNGNSLQSSGLGNTMDRGVWQVTVHGVTKSQTQVRN